MLQALQTLARDFDRLAVPSQGRYVDEPARADESGTTYVPLPGRLIESAARFPGFPRRSCDYVAHGGISGDRPAPLRAGVPSSPCRELAIGGRHR